MNRHLWSSYVADANGIQILTDAHVDKARDLTDWRVTPVAEGRWLVEANDLIPWCEGIDELKAERGWQYLRDDLREQARHDFGSMLLTDKVVAAHRARRG